MVPVTLFLFNIMSPLFVQFTDFKKSFIEVYLNQSTLIKIIVQILDGCVDFMTEIVKQGKAGSKWNLQVFDLLYVSACCIISHLHL